VSVRSNFLLTSVNASYGLKQSRVVETQFANDETIVVSDLLLCGSALEIHPHKWRANHLGKKERVPPVNVNLNLVKSILMRRGGVCNAFCCIT